MSGVILLSSDGSFFVSGLMFESGLGRGYDC